MNNILDGGLDVVIWFQHYSPTLDLFFRAISSLGTEWAYMTLIPLIYWCLDKQLGQRLIILLPYSQFANSTLKAWFDTPRPYEYAPERVQGLDQVASGGLPSGHSQTTLVWWVYVALWLRRRWLWSLAITMTLLVGLSRIYLGAHFPTDVLGGWAVGILLVVLFWRLGQHVAYWFQAQNLAVQVGLIITIPLLLFGLHQTNEEAKIVGMMLGIGLGVLWENRQLRFVTPGLLWSKTARYVLGLSIMMAWRFGLGLLFPSADGTLGQMFDMLRYVIVGLWTTLGAPWVFVRLGLAQRSSDIL